MRPGAALLPIAITMLPMAGAERIAHAQAEGRFDAQVFRPVAAPRDLVVVQKSEVIGHLSPTIGLYTDLGFDPLVILSGDTGQTIEAVAARLQVTGLAGIGLFDWLDLQLAVPFIAWQTSDNLRLIGTEGQVQSTAVGDMRVSSRVTLPYFNRKDEVTQGFGMALTGSVNLPTGEEKAFASDSVVTYGVTLVGDYRFDMGALITANLGVWLRPERQFAGVRLGDMASFGVAGEAYVVQRWGLSVLGGIYGYPSINALAEDITEIPAEAMLGLRWQTKQGITITVGGSFGAACGFGTPALRLFNGITMHFKGSREQEEINRILQRDRVDPDGDGLTGGVDRCPDEPGPPENLGCPDEDSDHDGWIDREDACPELPAGPSGRDGCPRAFIQGDRIVILDKVHFATDMDLILDESKPTIDAVAQVLSDHPEILEMHIEGHTDVRASDAYNINLSQRRVNSVMAYLIAAGIAPERLRAKGYGHLQPLVDDRECNRPDEELSPDCRLRTAQNRRVEFHIIRTSDDATPAQQ